jgi:hypothetical protein
VGSFGNLFFWDEKKKTKKNKVAGWMRGLRDRERKMGTVGDKVGRIRMERDVRRKGRKAEGFFVVHFGLGSLFFGNCFFLEE